jgi:hypothetical protein
MLATMGHADPELLIVVFVAIATLAIGVLAWRISRRRAAARAAAFQHQALLLGFTFHNMSVAINRKNGEEVDPQLAAPLANLQLFQKGRSARISNVLAKGGDRERTDWVFDFSFQTGSGKNSSTVRQTVLGCRLPDREFPAFMVQPEGLFSRLFDGKDIDFEQDPDFSKTYLLKGQDVQQVRRLFTPSVRSLLAAKKKWTVEASGPYLFACRKGHLIDPEDLLTARTEFERLLEALSATD